MAARKIPKNYRSVTGVFPSFKNKRSISYESLLERDFFLLLEFNEDVSFYEEQPFTIKYFRCGREYKYTPDCLVHYKNSETVPCVIEVKFSDEINRDKTFYDLKFKAIEEYIVKNDMNFSLFTELQIRTKFLENAQFLYRFAFLDRPQKVQVILNNVSENSKQTVSDVISRISDNKYEQAEYLPFLWQAVFSRQLFMDLQSPLSNNSLVWRS